jgi:hypothetical protein
MKLMRVGAAGVERPALLDSQGLVRDLSGHVSDIGGRMLLPDGLAKLRALDPSTLPRRSGHRSSRQLHRKWLRPWLRVAFGGRADLRQSRRAAIHGFAAARICRAKLA